MPVDEDLNRLEVVGELARKLIGALLLSRLETLVAVHLPVASTRKWQGRNSLRQ
jgi:hypothetical protein